MAQQEQIFGKRTTKNSKTTSSRFLELCRSSHLQTKTRVVWLVSFTSKGWRLEKGDWTASEWSSSVGADVWRERYKEHQDWVETMSGALPKLASTDKDERSPYAGRLDNSRMELLKLPPGVNTYSGPAGVNTRKRALQKTPRPHRVAPWSSAPGGERSSPLRSPPGIANSWLPGALTGAQPDSWQ